MILYCISLFLESSKIERFIKTCERYKEEAPLLKIECRMKHNDFIFYNDIISRIIGENLASRINVKENDCFAIDKIILKHNDKTITFVI